MNLSTGGVSRMLALGVVVVGLAGCTGLGGSDSGGVDGAASEPAAPSNVLSASQIKSILGGKTWRFKGPNNSGTTVYAADGTSLMEVDGKGTATGKWMTKDGFLCEQFNPGPLVPQGVPMSCYPFSGEDGTYQAGKATFTLAS